MLSTRGKTALLLLQLVALLSFAMSEKDPESPMLPQPPKVTDGQPLPEQVEPVFERCPQGKDWVKFRDSCYLLNKTLTYWEPAERWCKEQHNGHLVSIKDRLEDSFMAKLTYCRNTWLGLYAMHVDRLSDPANYRWTDGTNSQYHAHNFTGIPNVHYPLKSVHNLEWWNNVYHAKQPYVCEVPTTQRNYTCDCPPGWRQLDGFCYLMPSFEATYIEADFYCRGRDAYVASVHNERELRAMSLLDVESHGCPFDTWIGLVKLNPCRVDFSTGKKVCYRWSDRSGDYKDFPAWQADSPILDRETNCVLLQNEEIKSVPCYTRARFVCKKNVSAERESRQCIQ